MIEINADLNEGPLSLTTTILLNYWLHQKSMIHVSGYIIYTCLFLSSLLSDEYIQCIFKQEQLRKNHLIKTLKNAKHTSIDTT